MKNKKKKSLETKSVNFLAKLSRYWYVIKLYQKHVEPTARDVPFSVTTDKDS